MMISSKTMSKVTLVKTIKRVGNCIIENNEFCKAPHGTNAVINNIKPPDMILKYLIVVVSSCHFMQIIKRAIREKSEKLVEYCQLIALENRLSKFKVPLISLKLNGWVNLFPIITKILYSEYALSIIEISAAIPICFNISTLITD